MTTTKAHRVVSATLFFGCFAYFLATLIAMVFYPGGIITDKTTEGYDFFRNYYSDLGRWESFDGEQRGGISFYLFTLSQLGVGAVVAAFFAFWWRLFRARRSALALAVIGSVFGFLAGLCYAGIGVTPYDLVRTAHLAFVYAGFSCLSAMTLFYVAALFLNEPYPKLYSYVMLTLALSSIAFLMLMFFGPDESSEEGLAIQVVGQKCIIYMQIVTFAVLSRGVLVLDRARNGP